MLSFKTGIRILGLFCVLALFGCSEEAVLQNNEEGTYDGILFRCTDMAEIFKGENNTASRAGGPKNPDEKAVKTLHVFFFSMKTGKLLTTSDYHNFPAYRKVSDMSLIKIPTGEGVGNLFEEGNKDIRIVAIANIDATDDANDASEDANSFFTKDSPYGKIQQNGRDSGGTPFEITTYDDLKSWVYYPRVRMNGESGNNDISKLPAAGMPMIGELENVDLSQKPAQPYIVNMKALMAKVNLSVKLEPTQWTAEYPVLKITEYGVKNMPVAVPFTPCTGNLKSGGNKKPANYQEYIDSYDVTTVPMFHKEGTSAAVDHTDCNPEDHEYTTTSGLPVTINKDSEPVYFSYYTYENINLPDYSAKRANGIDDAFNDALEPQYPAGVAESDYQRWKPTIAYANRASALILKGEYTTDQGLTYQAQFTIYLGGDSDTDFMVKRNYRYDNNFIINGLDYVRNSTDDVFRFDGRVNIKYDNPLYLAIMNERKVDAHASVLPMDVRFLMTENPDGTINSDIDWNYEVTFTVRDHETVDWIRMEKKTRAQMEAGNFAAGTECRDYFTTDLVSNTLADNWEVKVTSEDKSRTRIYFYIDENVPTSNNPTNYGDRMATIDIHYKQWDKDGTLVDERERTLDIEQRSLLKVTGTWSGNGGETATIPVTWMEYYEEYLEHNDPLDKHESPGELYNGLPWGLSGTNAYSFGANNPDDNTIGQWNRYYKVYYKAGAWRMINWVFNQNGVANLNTVKLYNLSEPASAFHYCYGKNKRNSDGSAAVTDNKGWYMPGIRELEKALVDYYDIFPEFRGNLYWSASAAQETNGTFGYGQPGNYARATKVTLNGTTISYANSSSGQEGYNLRTKVNRIRAFYRVD